MAAITSQVCSEARECPATGLPTVTTTANAAASTAAQLQSHRPTEAPVMRAYSGRANSNAVTCSPVTRITEPKLSAAACRP